MNQHFLCGIPDLIQTLLNVPDVIPIDVAGFVGSFGVLVQVVAVPPQECKARQDMDVNASDTFVAILSIEK